MEKIIIKSKSSRKPFVEFELSDESNFFMEGSQMTSSTIEQKFIEFFEMPTGDPKNKEEELMNMAKKKQGNNRIKLKQYYDTYLIPIKKDKVNVPKAPKKEDMAKALIQLYKELKMGKSDDRVEHSESENEDFNDEYDDEYKEEDYDSEGF